MGANGYYTREILLEATMSGENGKYLGMLGEIPYNIFERYSHEIDEHNPLPDGEEIKSTGIGAVNGSTFSYITKVRSIQDSYGLVETSVIVELHPINKGINGIGEIIDQELNNIIEKRTEDLMWSML